MDGVTKTKHFSQRIQQRGITVAVVQALYKYGECHSSRNGVDSLVFTKAALIEIRNEHGSILHNACEKRRNAYIIASENGTLITVARSYRKTVH